jgi:hypothetical protein
VTVCWLRPCYLLRFRTSPSFRRKKKFHLTRKSQSLLSESNSLILASSVDVLLVESSSRLPAVSRQSLATSASSYLAVAVAPYRFRGNFVSSNLEPPMKSSIDSFIGFILYVTLCILHSIVVSPTSPQKGDSLSDPSPSLLKFAPNPLHPLHRVPKSFSSHPSVNPRRCRSLTSPQKGDSLSNPCFILGPTTSSSSSVSTSSNQFPQVTSRVIHRSILIYPIHAFALDPPRRSLTHFIRIVSCRPSHLIDV